MSSSRRSSASSIADPSSPLINPQSPPELVLVNDADSPNEELDFSSDDGLSDEVTSQPNRFSASVIPPLSPTLVLLYLTVPYLKLGPIFLLNGATPLSQSIPTLLLCAAFAAFTRELWYLLARYLRKTDTEDVILDVFARGSDKARTRLLLRIMGRMGTFIKRVSLASLPLRVSVDALLPLVPSHALARVLLTAALALALLPLYAARSLAAKRIIYATWASFFAYLIWLGAVSYAHAKGTLSTDPHWQRPGVLWQAITTTAFVFSSSWTIPLYASLRSSTPPAAAKRRRRFSFRTLIAASVAITVVLVVPLCIFAPYSKRPNTSEQGAIPLMALSSAANLILTIPAILITIPPPSLPSTVRRTNSTVSKIIIYVVATTLSILPRKATIVLFDLCLVLSLLSSYILPAFLHITVHYFRSPLSIVLPTSVTRTADGEGDELLLRKERSLQRRRLGRRLVWDAVSWVSVLLLGVGGSAWAVGRLLGKW